MQKWIVGFVLVDFTALTVATLAMSGSDGFMAMVEGGNLWTLTLIVDLVIALAMACVWMWRDGKARGMNPAPYILLTCLTGSVGPLLYLLRRPKAETHGRALPLGRAAASPG